MTMGRRQKLLADISPSPRRGRGTAFERSDEGRVRGRARVGINQRLVPPPHPDSSLTLQNRSLSLKGERGDHDQTSGLLTNFRDAHIMTAGPETTYEADIAARPTRKRFEVLALLTLAAAVAYLVRVAIGVAESTIREDLGLTLEQSGWFMGAFFWSYALLQVPAAGLTQRRGTRLTLFAFATAWSLAALCIGMAPGLWLLIAAQLVMGAAQARAVSCGVLLGVSLDTAGAAVVLVRRVVDGNAGRSDRRRRADGNVDRTHRLAMGVRGSMRCRGSSGPLCF